MSTLRVCAVVIAALVAIGFASGCKVTALVPNENDALRSQVRDLSEKVKSLEAQRIELQQQLAHLAKDAQEKSSIDPDILAATPHVATVQIGGTSHFQLAKPAVGSPDVSSERGCLARVYLDPSDGLGRFLQIVGSVKISVFKLNANGDSQTLGHADYSPAQVRDAWRGGLMGTHYTFEIPLSGTDWQCQGSATATMEFHDGMTGRTFTAQRELVLQK